MANFPFVVQPRLKPIIEKIGSETAGYVEIRRQGYLSVGEKAGMKQIMTGYDVTQDVIALAKKVGTDRKLDLQAAYELVSSAVTRQDNDDIYEAYEEEIGQLLQRMTQAQVWSEMAKAFVLLMYRVEGANELTMEDVAEMHPDIIEGLSDLYDEEESKSVERLVDESKVEAEEIEETAGK